jgi:hypothetical protein
MTTLLTWRWGDLSYRLGMLSTIYVMYIAIIISFLRCLALLLLPTYLFHDILLEKTSGEPLYSILARLKLYHIIRATCTFECIIHSTSPGPFGRVVQLVHITAFKTSCKPF